MDVLKPDPIELSVRRFVPKAEAMAVFASSPALDYDDVRADLHSALDYELRDPEIAPRA
jgi:hypothetical protein